MNSLPQHSKAPWVESKSNPGTIEDAAGAVVAYVRLADELACISEDEYARAEARCAANVAVVKAAPALAANLLYAVWCLENGVPVTHDSLTNMKTALALATVGVKGGVA